MATPSKEGPQSRTKSTRFAAVPTMLYETGGDGEALGDHDAECIEEEKLPEGDGFFHFAPRLLHVIQNVVQRTGKSNMVARLLASKQERKEPHAGRHREAR